VVVACVVESENSFKPCLVVVHIVDVLRERREQPSRYWACAQHHVTTIPTLGQLHACLATRASLGDCTSCHISKSHPRLYPAIGYSPLS
jgi:hypothetical protein